jgi:hypothetical protein
VKSAKSAVKNLRATREQLERLQCKELKKQQTAGGSYCVLVVFAANPQTVEVSAGEFGQTNLGRQMKKRSPTMRTNSSAIPSA